MMVPGLSTSHSHSSRRVPREPENFVHSDRFHRETIRKELACSQLYTQFTINPFRPGHAVTGKPNSYYEAEFECGQEDEAMNEILRQARRVPTAKYDNPQTSSQEYGWYSKPLLDGEDRLDLRLTHWRSKTDVTKIKEEEWKSGIAKPPATRSIVYQLLWDLTGGAQWRQTRSQSRRSRQADGNSTYEDPSLPYKQR